MGRRVDRSVPAVRSPPASRRQLSLQLAPSAVDLLGPRDVMGPHLPTRLGHDDGIRVRHVGRLNLTLEVLSVFLEEVEHIFLSAHPFAPLEARSQRDAHAAPLGDALGNPGPEPGVSLAEVLDRARDDVLTRDLREAAGDVVHEPLLRIGRLQAVERAGLLEVVHLARHLRVVLLTRQRGVLVGCEGRGDPAGKGDKAV